MYAKKLYLAGPMTGYSEWNFPAFHEAERLLKARFQVVNPALNFGGDTTLPKATYIRADVRLLVNCDCAIFLPGWEYSHGATLEYIIAQACEMPCYDYSEFKNSGFLVEIRRKVDLLGVISGELDPEMWDKHAQGCELSPDQSTTASETVLQEAMRITSADRQEAYGHPRDNFKMIADLWSVYLGSQLTKPLTASNQAVMMMLVKIAREANAHKRDNCVDIAGYARTLAQVEGDEE